MHERMITVQATATRMACLRMTAQHIRAIHECFEEKIQLSARRQWEQKAGAHAEIFNRLADAADDPVTAAVLSAGAALVRDLALAVGPAADGMIVSSHRRLLAHLRAGDADGAAQETEDHLRVLHYMWRLAGRSASAAPDAR